MFKISGELWIFFLIIHKMLCYDILFPTSSVLTWSLADLSLINCDSGGYQDVNRNGLKIKSYAPFLKDNYTSAGYLCIKTMLVTECSENFFGGQTIKYHSYSMNIDPSECSDAILNWMGGDRETVEHPAPSCSWMRTSAETVKEIEVRQHSHSSTKVSDLFIHGHCKGPYCKTIKEDTIWMSQDNHLPQCIRDILSPIYVFAREGEEGHYAFWSPDFPLQSAKRICVNDFCGMSGFMFDDGSWIGVKKMIFPKTIS